MVDQIQSSIQIRPNPLLPCPWPQLGTPQQIPAQNPTSRHAASHGTYFLFCPLPSLPKLQSCCSCAVSAEQQLRNLGMGRVKGGAPANNSRQRTPPVPQNPTPWHAKHAQIQRAILRAKQPTTSTRQRNRGRGGMAVAHAPTSLALHCAALHSHRASSALSASVV